MPAPPFIWPSLDSLAKKQLPRFTLRDRLGQCDTDPRVLLF